MKVVYRITSVVQYRKGWEMESRIMDWIKYIPSCRYCESEMPTLHGELSFPTQRLKKKERRKPHFLHPIPKLFVLASCRSCSSWGVELEMLQRDFAGNPGRRQVSVCKTTVAGPARFLKQPSYEIFSVKLYDSFIETFSVWTLVWLKDSWIQDNWWSKQILICLNIVCFESMITFFFQQMPNYCLHR